MTIRPEIPPIPMDIWELDFNMTQNKLLLVPVLCGFVSFMSPLVDVSTDFLKVCSSPL